MPSPTAAGTATSVAKSSQLLINALLEGHKWGGALGTGVTLTYSFPWADGGAASFFGANGSSQYSDAQEHLATKHFAFNATQQAAAVAALQSWSAVANLTFVKSVDNSTTVGDIRLAWSSALTGDTLAWGSTPDSVEPNGGDIWFNANKSELYNGSWAVGSQNYSTLIHELGHALGFKHPFGEPAPALPAGQDTEQFTVMSYTDGAHSLFGFINASGGYETRKIEAESPMVYDIAAMQYLYGANTSYKTGSDTYTFDPATPFMRTIWDAGGTDTISVSNFTKGCIIDLQPGHYSRITIESASTAGFDFSNGATKPTYDGTDNLGIAFGCIIENAIGGSGNDTLIGNSANNNLTGGAGNDTLDGGEGVDTASFSGTSTSATITYNPTTNKFTVVSAGGTDTLSNIEFASFSDKVVDLTKLGAPADDYAAGIGTTGKLAVGSSTSGRVETSGDADWFAVALTAGTTYRFDQLPAAGSALSSQVKIYNSFGGLLATGVATAGNASQLTYTPTAGGTYFVSAGSLNSSIGSYSVAAKVAAGVDDYLAGTGTTGKLAVNGSVTGKVETSGDKDWFAITLKADTNYRFDQFPATGSALSSQVKIYNSFGSLLATGASTEGGASQVSYKPAVGGTYYVSAGASNTSTGSYRVSAFQVGFADDFAATTATTGKLAIDSFTTGKIETSADTDWFAVTLASGSTYRFDQTPFSGNLLSSQIKLYNSAGTLLSTGNGGLNGSSQLSFKATAAGTYYVSAGNLNGSTGGYTVAATLTAGVDDFAASTVTTGKATVGGTAQGNVEAVGDSDWFAVTLAAGATYTINVKAASGSTLDPLLRLYNNVASLMDSNDDGGGGVNASLTYKAITGGTYYVAASGMNSTTGAYTVSVTNNDSSGPDLSSIFPDNGAADVAVDSNITVIFSEPVKRGTGIVQLALDDGTVVESFNIATSQRVTVNGVVVTIDPSANLQPGTHYHMVVPAGAVVDLAGNGIDATDAYNFTTEAKGLEVVSVTPEDGALNAALNSNITVVFSDPVVRGAGMVDLVLDNGTLVERFNVATSDRITINGGTVTIDPTAPLKSNTHYKLVVPAGVILDQAGNGNLATDAYDFTTRNEPAVQSGKISGTAGSDNLLAGSGNDTLAGSAGNDVFDGGAGLDTVRYQGARSAFTVLPDGNGGLTVDKGADGKDVLANVERLVFDDKAAMAFDTDASGIAGQAYRMYQAAFDRAPDATGLGFWIAMMDNGVTQGAVAAGFVNSPEFKALYGASPTNEELVTRLYNNVLHRAPEQGGYAFWLDVLNKKLAPVSDVLAAFSESPENQQTLAAVIGGGVSYDLFVA